MAVEPQRATERQIITLAVDRRYINHLRKDATDLLESIAGDLLSDTLRCSQGQERAAPETPQLLERLVRIAGLLRQLAGHSSEAAVQVTCDADELLRGVQSGLYREADDLKDIAESASVHFEDVKAIADRIADSIALADQIERQTGEAP